MSDPLSFQQVCDSVPLGIVILTGEYRVVYWNRWLEKKTGIPAVETTGKTLKELYPDFENKRFTWAMENVLNNHSPQVLSQSLNHFLLPIPINNRGRHGLSLMQQHVQIAPVPGPQGSTLAMISIQDVTENVIRSSAYTELAQKLMEDSLPQILSKMANNDMAILVVRTTLCASKRNITGTQVIVITSEMVDSVINKLSRFCDFTEKDVP